jgi:hypothetical protein
MLSFAPEECVGAFTVVAFISGIMTGVGTEKHNVKSFFLWNDVVVQLA